MNLYKRRVKMQKAIVFVRLEPTNTCTHRQLIITNLHTLTRNTKASGTVANTPYIPYFTFSHVLEISHIEHDITMQRSQGASVNYDIRRAYGNCD